MRGLFFSLSLLLPSFGIAQAPWPRHTIDASSDGADGVRLADADGDGLEDIATAWEEGAVIRVYRNPGPTKVRTRWPLVTVGGVASPEDAVLVDLDGDGHSEVVSAAEGRTRGLFVHRGTPRDYWTSGSWATEPVALSMDRMMWMFSTPISIQGKLHVAAGGKGEGAAIGLWTIPGWQWRKLADAGWVMTLDAHDMEGDGDEDLLFSDRKGPLRGIGWFENPGADQANWVRHGIGPQNEAEVMFIETGDLNGDGLEDVAAAVKPRDLWLFYRQDQQGRKWRREIVPLPDTAGTAKAVAIGDINGDGRADLVYSCEQAAGDLEGVGWIEQLADGWRPYSIGGPAGVKFDLVRLRDLDQDGDLDVITCEEAENLGVIWYENPTRQ